MSVSVLVYGTGEYFRAVEPFIAEIYNVIALVDSNPAKSSKLPSDYHLIGPAQIHSYQFDFVIIASSFELEIKKQLKNVGISGDKVKTIDGLPEIMKKIESTVLLSIRNARPTVADKTKYRLAIVMNDLGKGGAEKALISLLGRIDASKFQIYLYLINANGFYLNKVPEQVVVLPLFSKEVSQTLVNIWLKHTSAEIAYRALMQGGEDLAIAFIEGWATKIVAGRQEQGKLAWVHTNLYTNHWTKACFENVDEERRAYQAIEHTVFVSQNAKEGFDEAGYRAVNHSVIHNLIEAHEVSEASTIVEQRDCPRLVYIGRLTEIKGVERLVRAFALLHSDYSGAQLLIIGSGEQDIFLKELVRRLQLGNAVEFKGFVENPYSILTSQDIFVNPSFTEGYSLAVAEAMCAGLPIIATKCTGNIALLNNGEFGLLADNTDEGIYSALKDVYQNDNLRQELRAKAINGQKQFSSADIVNSVQRLVMKVIRSRKGSK